MKYPATKAIKRLLRHIDGAWVRTWPDGATWCGVKDGHAAGYGRVRMIEALNEAGVLHEPFEVPGTSGYGSTKIKMIPSHVLHAAT